MNGDVGMHHAKIVETRSSLSNPYPRFQSVHPRAINYASVRSASLGSRSYIALAQRTEDRHTVLLLYSTWKCPVQREYILSYSIVYSDSDRHF